MKKLLFILLFIPTLAMGQGMNVMHKAHQIVSVVQTPSGSPYTDDFESYTEGILGGQGDWVTIAWTMTVVDVSGDNRVYASVNTDFSATLYDKTFDNDQYAKCTFDQVGTSFIGPGVRLTGTTPSTLNGYGIYASSTVSRLVRYDKGSKSNLGTSGSGAALTDVFELRVEGTTLSCYKNGALDTSLGTSGNYTDATHSSGQAGLNGYDNSNTTTIDTWEGGDL